MRKFVGLFTIFLITTLSFAPALNNADLNIDLNNTLGPLIPPKKNDTNNDTVIINNNTTTNNTTNIPEIVKVEIIFPTFNYLDYFTPVGEIDNPLAPSTRKDFNNKKEGLKNATNAYIKWTDEVAKIADDAYAKGENTYDSGYNTKFRHVPTQVMKSIYEQDCRIDAGFSQVSAYYSALDAKYTKVITIAGTIAGLVTGLTAFITGMIVLCNTACTAAAVATGGVSETATAAPQAAFTKTMAVIITFIVAIGASVMVMPESLIKADLAEQKGDIEKTNVKYQPIHVDAKIEVPRLSNNNIPITTTINKFSLKNDSNNINDSNINNSSNNNNSSIIQIVTPGFEYTEKLSVSDMNKIKTNALNNLDVNKWNYDYGVKDFMDWNPSSWTDKIPQPVWDPPKWDPPYGGKAKWYEVWKWIAIAGYATWYGLEYTAYSAWYGLQWVAYGVAYAGAYLAYAIYWLGDMVAIAIYNMTKYEAVSDDIKKLTEIYS